VPTGIMLLSRSLDRMRDEVRRAGLTPVARYEGSDPERSGAKGAG
jgi:hypothetical protein